MFTVLERVKKKRKKESIRNFWFWFCPGRPLLGGYTYEIKRLQINSFSYINILQSLCKHKIAQLYVVPNLWGQLQQPTKCRSWNQSVMAVPPLHRQSPISIHLTAAPWITQGSEILIALCQPLASLPAVPHCNLPVRRVAKRDGAWWLTAARPNVTAQGSVSLVRWRRKFPTSS